MELIKQHWKKICFAMGLMIFLVIVKFLLDDNLVYFDNSIYKIITLIKNPLITNTMKFISFFASPLFCIISVIIIFN